MNINVRSKDKVCRSEIERTKQNYFYMGKDKNKTRTIILSKKKN